jgi:hypothetical protein
LPNDGDIDYRSYSRAALEEALGRIDVGAFPINHARLLRELSIRPLDPPKTSLSCFVSVPKSIAGACFAAGATVLCLYVATEPELFWLICGSIGAFFFGYHFLRLAAATTQRQAVVALTEAGLADTRLGGRLISWTSMSRISVETQRSRGAFYRRYIHIHLCDEEQFLDSLPFWRRLSAWANGVGSPLSILFVGLTPGLDAAVAWIREKHPRLLAPN